MSAGGHAKSALQSQICNPNTPKFGGRARIGLRPSAACPAGATAFTDWRLSKWLLSFIPRALLATVVTIPSLTVMARKPLSHAARVAATKDAAARAQDAANDVLSAFVADDPDALRDAARNLEAAACVVRRSVVKLTTTR